MIQFFAFIMFLDWTDQGSFSRFRSASLPMQRFQALSSINQTLLHKRVPSSGVMDPTNLLDPQASNGINISPSGLDINDKTFRTSIFASPVAEYTVLPHASSSEISTEDQVQYFIFFGCNLS